MEFNSSDAIAYFVDSLNTSTTHYQKWRPCFTQDKRKFYLNDYFEGVKVQAYSDRTIFEFSPGDMVTVLDANIYRTIKQIKENQNLKKRSQFMESLKKHYEMDWKL